MISSTTVRVVFVALIAVASSSALAGFLLYEIDRHSELLQEQIVVAREDQVREATRFRLERIARETAADRTELRNYFFNDQSDSIEFLNYVEARASALGVTLHTQSIEITEVGLANAPSLTIRFQYQGPRSVVADHTRLLERLPYHSRLQTLSKKQVTGDLWEASVSLTVAMNQYGNQ
jgi:hypothetical protein